jgi:predicted GIY-YIG superfamily endonuclease
VTDHKKRSAQYHEGAHAASRFETTMHRLLRVSKEELVKRQKTAEEKSSRSTTRRTNKS